MERIFDWLVAAGYPRTGVDWLRQRRLAIIVVLAVASWGLLIGLGWLALTLLF